jgi:hypothetical protein
MDYQQTTETSLYLLSTLNFDLGDTAVRLYGGVKVARNEFTFVLADKLGPEFALPEHADATRAIIAPFGMTGVTLEEFQAAGSIRKDEGDTVADLVLHAKARLHGLSLNLDGSLVFEKSLPRLVVVELKADHPLTLRDFVISVLGGQWEWMDQVTRQFAFKEGSLYYLSSTGATWKDPATGLEYLSGYHIRAKLRLFESYDFDIRLDADTKNKAITVKGSVARLDFDFVTFEKPELQISSRSAGPYFRLSTESLIVLGSSFKVGADYHDGEFRGRVEKSFDVDIPAIGSSSRRQVNLAVGFAWTSGAGGGFRITEISGLPTNVLDLAAEFEKYLNEIHRGGCEKMVSGWLKDLCKTKFEPALNGKPTREGGKMKVPLKLSYTIDFGERRMASEVIPFDALFEVPTSLSNLPSALWGSVVASVPTIVEGILGNPGAYKALAMECARRYGAAALARFICRAARQFGQDFAKSLASEAGAIAAADVAAAAELAAAIAALSVTVARSIIDEFADWIKNIWDQITGKKEEKEKQDNARIAAQAAQLRAAMNRVWEKVRALADTQPVTALKVRVDSDQYVAHWARNDISSQLPEGAALEYEFQPLSGSVGDRTGAAWAGMSPRIEPAGKEGVTFPITSIPNYRQFELNASVRGRIAGIRFLTPEIDRQLSSAINGLRNSDLSAATDLANQLSDDLRLLRGYHSNGVRTGPVYAALDMPALMTVGQSRIGVNTRIRRK